MNVTRTTTGIAAALWMLGLLILPPDRDESRQNVPEPIGYANAAATGRPVIPQHHARNRPYYGPLVEEVVPVLNSMDEVVDWELIRTGRADSGPIKVSYGETGHFQTFTPDWSRRQWATNYGLTVDYSVPQWAQIP